MSVQQRAHHCLHSTCGHPNVTPMWLLDVSPPKLWLFTCCCSNLHFPGRSSFNTYGSWVGAETCSHTRLFNFTVTQCLGFTHSLSSHLEGSSIVGCDTLSVCAKVWLNLLPHLLFGVKLFVWFTWNQKDSLTTQWFIAFMVVFKGLIVVPGNPWKVTLSPGTAPPGGSRISTLSCELAHMTTAWFNTPLVLTGFRLHSRTAMRFCICRTNRRRISFDLKCTKTTSVCLFYITKLHKSLNLKCSHDFFLPLLILY